MDTLTYSVHFDSTAWCHRWRCATCPETGTEDTARAAEVVAQAHADVHAVRRGW